MFFEFSLKRVATLGIIVAVLIAGIIGFALANGKLAFVARTNDLLSRMEANALYALSYGGRWNASASANADAGKGNAQAIPVLLYHGAPPEGNSNPPLPQDVFVDQMKALKADGWQTITMGQFEAFMKKGTPLPAKSFLLTFDDGRKESFYPVDPVLKDTGYSAVMFVITGFSLPDSGANSNFYLSKTELEYMAESGRWELESHGDQDHRLYDVPSATSTDGVLGTIHQQHFLSNKFWIPALTRVETSDQFSGRVTADLFHSKSVLEKDFGKPVVAFAYPFNDYGQDSANFAGSVAALSNIVPAIYEFGFYQVNPAKDDPYNYPDPGAYRVKRIEPIASWSGQDLVALLDGASPKTLPYMSGDFASGWGGNWGSVIPAGGILALRATSKTSGSVALLNGSESWQNYSADATVDWKKGGAVSLIARYQSDSKTFLSCAFLDDRVALEGHDNGVQATLASTELPSEVNRNNLVLSMSVEDASATCGVQGASASATVGAAFVHPGAVGIEVWDSALNAAALDVKKVSVHEF